MSRPAECESMLSAMVMKGNVSVKPSLWHTAFIPSLVRCSRAANAAHVCTFSAV